MFSTKKMIPLAVAASLSVSLLGVPGFGSYDQAVAKSAKSSKVGAKTSQSSDDFELAKKYDWIDADHNEDDKLTRLDLALILANALNLRKPNNTIEFKDVPTEYADAVSSVVNTGFMEGVSKDEFHPEDQVLRKEYAEIIANAITKKRIPKVDTNVLNHFKDEDEIDRDDRNLLAYAALKGILDLGFQAELDAEEVITVEDAVSGMKPLVFEDIDILSTNDIHGNIEYSEKYENGGMGIVAGIVEQYRSVNKSGTIVVDAGDTFQGTLISNAFEGRSTFETLNRIGYDAGAIGNHEFDFGMDVLKDRIKQAKFPLLSANIYDEKTGRPVSWVKPYTIVKKDKLSIGIIGLSTLQTPSTTLATNIKGLEFRETAPIAKKLAKELKEKGADIVIVNSHLPGEIDKSGDVIGELAEFAEDVSVDDIQAVIGGHSHQRVAAHVNDIPVVEAQTATAAIGHIRLFVDKKTEEVVSSEVSLLETKKGLAAEKRDVNAIIKKYQGKVEAIKNEVVGVATDKITRDSVHQIKRGNIDKDKAREGVTPLGNLITDSMREKENADIAFTNIGGIRTDIDAGEITYGEVFSVLPFDNWDVVGEMTAEQIKEVLEVLDKYSNLPALQVSGLKYEWDNTREKGDKIVKITLIDGTPVYVDGKYSDDTFKVTTNNFLIAGNADGYGPIFSQAKWTDTPNFQREILADYLRDLKKQGKEISPIIDDRETRLDPVE